MDGKLIYLIMRYVHAVVVSILVVIYEQYWKGLQKTILPRPTLRRIRHVDVVVDWTVMIVIVSTLHLPLLMLNAMVVRPHLIGQ